MDVKEAQDQIDGVLVARMIQEFWIEFEGAYPMDIHTSGLCAVGPLSAMIGLAIKNGHLMASKPLPAGAAVSKLSLVGTDQPMHPSAALTPR